MTASVRLTAPAKLNLTLRVLARESSGYHQLESVFIGITLADALTLVPNESGEIRLDVVGDVGGAAGPDNLVHRAAASFLERFAAPGAGLSAKLEKAVPVAAGLGGGSADAAATLRGLSQLWPGRASADDLLALAAELGADVPFFLTPTPYALAWGRGGRLLELQPPPVRPLLIAIPGEGVSTAEAYGQLASKGALRVGEPMYHTFEQFRSWEFLGRDRVNDFEAALYPERPDLAVLARKLEATTPLMSGMTGSGAAHYGVYVNEDARDAARVELENASDIRLFSAETLSEWPASESSVDPSPS